MYCKKQFLHNCNSIEIELQSKQIRFLCYSQRHLRHRSGQCGRHHPLRFRLLGPHDGRAHLLHWEPTLHAAEHHGPLPGVNFRRICCKHVNFKKLGRSQKDVIFGCLIFFMKLITDNLPGRQSVLLHGLPGKLQITDDLLPRVLGPRSSVYWERVLRCSRSGSIT